MPGKISEDTLMNAAPNNGRLPFYDPNEGLPANQNKSIEVQALRDRSYHTGSLNNTPVGDTTPSTGAFTTLKSNSVFSSNNGSLTATDYPSSNARFGSSFDGQNLHYVLSYGANPAMIQGVAGGTKASPTGSSGSLAIFAGLGYDTTNGWGNGTGVSSSRISFITAETFSPTGHGSHITFDTTPVGSTVASRAERLRIAADGHVGIGTSAPTRKLTVSLASTVTDPAGDGGSQVLSLENTDATDQNTAGIAFAAYDTNPTRRNAAGIFTKFSNRSASGVSGTLSFWTKDGANGVTERMTISPTGIVTIDQGTGALPSLITNAQFRLAQADGTANGIQADSYGAGTGLQLLARRAGGTRATPTATDIVTILDILAYGHDGTSLTTSPSARYQILSPSAWSGTNRETAHRWIGTPNGSTTAATWMELNNGTLILSGALQLSNAYAAGNPTTTGYLVVKDSTGTSYKIPAVAL